MEDIEELLAKLDTSELSDILRIILIRLGQHGLISVDELALLCAVEDLRAARSHISRAA